MYIAHLCALRLGEVPLRKQVLRAHRLVAAELGHRLDAVEHEPRADRVVVRLALERGGELLRERGLLVVGDAQIRRAALHRRAADARVVPVDEVALDDRLGAERRLAEDDELLLDELLLHELHHRLVARVRLHEHERDVAVGHVLDREALGLLDLDAADRRALPHALSYRSPLSVSAPTGRPTPAHSLLHTLFWFEK